MTGDRRDTEPATDPLATVTRMGTTTTISVSTITSHHHSASTETDATTVFITSSSSTAAAPAFTVTAFTSSTTEFPIAAVAVPVGLAALVMLLILPCCRRRFTPRLWNQLSHAIPPLEDAYAGVAAAWARMKLTRQRNRDLRARAMPLGTAILTGDGRGSGARRSEKQAEEGAAEDGGDGNGQGTGCLGRWRERQEEKLQAGWARRKREERFGLDDRRGSGAVEACGVRYLEDVRRDELRRVKESRFSGEQRLGP